MEYIDVFDVNYNHLGKEEKDKAHLEGLWHHTFHCWIVRPNNKILLQLRSKDKSTHPNLLDISAAGHLSAGETVEDGIREIKEELGIDIDFNNLRKIGFYKQVVDIPSKKGIFHNKEFTHVFLLKDDTPLEQYVLQPEEVDGVYELDIDDGFKLFNGEVDSISVAGFCRESNSCKAINVGRNSFVDREYYYNNGRIFIMAERFINGEKYLGF